MIFRKLILISPQLLIKIDSSKKKKIQTRKESTSLRRKKKGRKMTRASLKSLHISGMNSVQNGLGFHGQGLDRFHWKELRIHILFAEAI